MRIAIIHDDLIQFGGAERLVLEMLNIWPDAVLFTSVVSDKWKKILVQKKIKYKTSFLQKFPFPTKLNRLYALLFLHPIAFETFNLDDFDVVISVSARFAHGVVTKPSTLHICYMNSPGRMIWEPANYFEKEPILKKWPIKVFANKILAISINWLKLWDFSSSKRVDVFIANSKVPQQRIRKYYNRNSTIIYPFVDFEAFSDVPFQNGEYFVVLSRLLPWKSIDIAIDACTSLNKKLIIIGNGPDLARLKKISKNNPNIIFKGYVSESEKKKILAESKALINTQFEDFGIVPLEAMALGKPVIAFGLGGVLETVIPGQTGEFFYSQDVESLKKLLVNFDSSKYDPNVCRIQAQKFDKIKFQESLRTFVESHYSEYKKYVL